MSLHKYTHNTSSNAVFQTSNFFCSRCSRPNITKFRTNIAKLRHTRVRCNRTSVICQDNPVLTEEWFLPLKETMFPLGFRSEFPFRKIHPKHLLMDDSVYEPWTGRDMGVEHRTQSLMFASRKATGFTAQNT